MDQMPIWVEFDIGDVRAANDTQNVHDSMVTKYIKDAVNKLVYSSCQLRQLRQLHQPHQTFTEIYHDISISLTGPKTPAAREV
jgi:hypothetical protein